MDKINFLAVLIAIVVTAIVSTIVIENRDPNSRYINNLSHSGMVEIFDAEKPLLIYHTMNDSLTSDESRAIHRIGGTYRVEIERH